MRSGTHLFSFRLERGDIRVLLSRRPHTTNIQNCRLEIGSLSCWVPGYNQAYQEFIEMMEFLGGVFTKELLSECHLCADYVGLDIGAVPVADQNYWVTRARNYSVYYESRNLTGVDIGKGGKLMLRVYDKIREIKSRSRHKMDTFLFLWGIGGIDCTPVTRFEFQVKRKALHQFRLEGKDSPIKTLADLNASLSSLWAYLTTEWVRLTAAPVDRKNKHQTRVASHKYWTELMTADFAGGVDVFRKTGSSLCDLPSLKLQMAGIGMTIAAALGQSKDDVESIITFSQDAIEGTIRGLSRNKTDFTKRMARKINRVVPFRDAQS